MWSTISLSCEKFNLLRDFNLLYFKEDIGEIKSELEPTMKRLKVKEDGELGGNEEEGEDESSLKIERLGSILRVGQDKVSFLICWELRTMVTSKSIAQSITQ